METLITVILPTYNRRNFLPSALKCIAEQTFPSWRLLIINDGGEEVADIVESFHEPRFEYYSRPHQGKSAALNFGLSLVQSKYIGYMDDDDEVYPEHLQVLYDAAENNHSDFVYSDTLLTILKPDGKVESQSLENTKDVKSEDLRLFNCINHKQILHTKKLADRVGLYDVRLKILIDYDYIKRLATISEPYHVRKTTGNHFLRKTEQNNDFSSISGIWSREPAIAGYSLILIFEKNAEDMAFLYRTAGELFVKNSVLKASLDRTCADLEYTKTELESIKNSTIWRRTALLRTFLDRVKQLFCKTC